MFATLIDDKTIKVTCENKQEKRDGLHVLSPFKAEEDTEFLQILTSTDPHKFVHEA